MEINYSTIIFAMINFLILFFALKHFFFDKVKKVVEDREEAIEDKIIQADENAEKARIFMIENERILKSAKQEGKKITQRQKEKADAIYNEIVADANKEANAIMERAKKEIEREKQKAEYELKEETINIALMLSEKVLEEAIDKNKHRELIDDFIAKVGN